MKNVSKSVLIWYSPEEMFSLVTDVSRYPEFLPWCDHGKVLEEDEAGMVAEVGISFSGVRQDFVTRNDHIEGRRVDMRLLRGPFSRLDGGWQFVPLGDGAQRAGFDNATLAKLVGPVFDKIASSLVDAFVKRAEQVYG